ncbi:MAG: AAA family ATPase [Actinomycetota bacterium]|nr:AAA family ATPase [Actinomycetota bacterium]
MACAQPLVAEAPTGEERKVVSVLFVDLVGFTDRSDRADPEDVRATLRPYHERVKADIERFGGTVEKFIGDAVMAVFGAPVAHEDDAERAVRAALRILETMAELRSEGLDVAVRAAVTTGQAVVSLGARPERGEGMVTGDVVNTAARLQSAAPVGSVIVDAVTMRSAEGAIEFEPLEPVAAKGKQAPIPVWLASEARSRFGVDTDLRAATLFVGRDSELALLSETFARALREPSAQLVTVVGEPGLGKSRVVWEFREEIDRRSELVRWRQGRCLPYGEGITFWALGEIVKAEAGILETDSPADALEKLARSVADTVEDESERAWFTERLAPLVGAQDEAVTVGREEAFSAWRRYLEALSAGRPTVLVLEDLHWADGALLDFVEHLLDWAAGVPLLVLATARPELHDVRQGWGGGRRNSATVGLSPLSDEDTARLVAALLERSVLPAETQAALLERAGGNPLYTEQFVRMLVDREDFGDAGLPETVQALIAARLDTLGPELKGLLQDASVLGKVFWTGALGAMGDRSRESVLAGVRELVRREFIRPARLSSMRDEEEFSFWHVLVRDVAYEQIPRSARAEKHVHAAGWIEREADERVSDHAEILVHHYEQALELRRAVGDAESARALEPRLARFLILAGDRAMHLDMTAAEVSYRRSLELAGKSPARAVALVKLGDALNEQGRLLEAESAYEDAVEALRSAGDERAAALGMVGLARALWRHGKTVRAQELIREAMPILEREPGAELLLAYERAASVDAMGGRPTEAIAWAEKGMALAGELGVENVVRHLQMRGVARIELGDPGGLEDLRDALDLSLRLGLGIETGTSYLNLGEMVAPFEDLHASIELLDASLDFARHRGLTHHEMWTRSAQLFHLYERGRWDELLQEAEEILRWDQSQGRSQIEVWVLRLSAPVRAQRGDVAEAEKHAEIFLPRAREIGDPQTLIPSLVGGALVYALTGKLDDALRLIEEFEQAMRGRPNWQSFMEVPALPTALSVCAVVGALDLGEQLLSGSAHGATANRGSRLALVTGRAILSEARGSRAEAAVLYREAAQGWSEWGSVVQHGYALLGLGRCGDEDAAREAAAFFDGLRARPLAALAA